MKLGKNTRVKALFIGLEVRFRVVLLLLVSITYVILSCSRETVPSLNVTQLTTNTGFRLTIDPRVDYGPNFGVYIANGKADSVSSFCASGSDTGAISSIMKPHINPSVIYSCG